MNDFYFEVRRLLIQESRLIPRSRSRFDFQRSGFTAESALVSAMCGDSENYFVSSYELYAAPFGSSADRVFRYLQQHPFVAGGFVWSGWDYIGEPTPYYDARSSYFWVIDLAGFRKDRFYLYQSHWRPPGLWSGRFRIKTEKRPAQPRGIMTNEVK